MGGRAVDDPVVAGRDALARGEWELAGERFRAALAGSESAAAWEGLGWTGWWLADSELTFAARESAYRLHRARGDRAGAGRVATWLAADHREYRGEEAAGRGWLSRAHRLLDDLPESDDHGWLALTDADFALNVDSDPEAARDLAAAAVAIGRRVGVADLEAVGLAIEGLSLVLLGELDDGMLRLDEASAIAAGEELVQPISAGWTVCCAVSACDRVGDLDRAAQWCAVLREIVERWGGRQLLGVCRTSYGRVLTTRGEWTAAEDELAAAVRDLESARPGIAASGLVRLAELRARQGRVEEARALLERSGPAGLTGLGALALDEGDPVRAAELAERSLRRLPDSALLDRLPALELLARARAARGEGDAATAALAELARAAEPYATPYLRGRAAATAAAVAAARGDEAGSRRAYEDAIDCFDEGSAPYDAALAGLGLARVLAAAGRGAEARAEAEAARETFAGLGARRDAERCDELLAEPAATAPAAGAGPLGELTPRELEVLRLIAHGLSDAQIAERLVLSPHTVHRHVANVRVKLGLRSRSAAVAYAAREGLL